MPNKLKNQPLFLVRSVREVQSQGKPLLPKLNRQVNTENLNLPKHKFTCKNLYGNQWRGKENSSGNDKLLEAHVDKSESLKFQEDSVIGCPPHFCDLSLLEQSGSHSNYQRKSSWCLSASLGKRNHSEICWSTPYS